MDINNGGYSDNVNNRNGNGERNFTSLEIAPDYGADDISGEYDNDFASPGSDEHSSRYNRNPLRNRQQQQQGQEREHPSRNGDSNDFKAVNAQQMENNNREPKDYDGDYRRQWQTLPSDYRKFRSRPDAADGNVNVGYQDEDSPDGNTRENLEMRRMEEGGRWDQQSPRSDGDGDGDGLRKRRTKSQRLNGYDYYRQRHVHRRSLEAEPNPDYDYNTLPGQKLTWEGIAQTRQFLATIRVRRKSKKKGSSKRDGGGEGAGTERSGEAGGEVDSNDGDNESYEEEIGLPSARGKMKGLAERMQLARQLDSASQVERLYTQRDSIWEIQSSKKVRKTSALKQALRASRNWIEEISYNINFWSQHFKEIEGQCGIATTTFFRFTRWLVKMNFLVFLIFFCFLYVPQFVVWAKPSKNLFIEENKWNTSGMSSVGLIQSVTCSKAYTMYVGNISEYTGIPVLLDIAKGTGLLEDTSIYYGRYSNLSITYYSQSAEGDYKISTDFNMSLAYMLTMIGSFLIIFIMIVRTSSQSVRETIMDLENHAIPSYSNAVFSGWDYCINTEKMAFYKQKIIYNIFQAKLQEEEIKRLQQMKTRKQKVKLFAKRCFINLLVLIILGGCFTAIVFTTNYLIENQENNVGGFQSLLVEYLPSIVISVFNLIIPILFLVLVEKEEYSPARSTSLTIIRAVFLRISLVGVLLFAIYYRLFHKRDRELYYCPEESLSDTTSTCCGNPLWKTSTVTTGEEKGSIKCWETYVGQQFYKLSIADFVNTCVIFLGFCTIRKVLFFNFKDRVWFISKLGLQRFDLPLEVLDIVYTQTLCWVGMFFAPLLPLFCLVQTFIYFFVKKYILLRLCETPKNTYRASRSYSFFQVVLLVTFTIICVILGYMIGNIQPSKGCGPFRVYSSPDHVMFDAITNEINSWPSIPKGIFNFFGTMGFILPAFLILAMAIYYYWTVSQGYKRLEELLQNQLKSESYDKQYLLARVDEVIKKGQLNLHDEGW